jgi:hypothetical protein
MKWLAIFCWAVFWIGAAVRILRPGLRWIRVTQIIFIVLLLVAGGSWCVAMRHSSSFDAVVLRETGLRSGDGEVYGAIDSLTAGQRIRCVDVRPGWLRIHAADSPDLAGWVKASDVLRFRQR